jgi:hypothetical protein
MYCAGFSLNVRLYLTSRIISGRKDYHYPYEGSIQPDSLAADGKGGSYASSKHRHTSGEVYFFFRPCFAPPPPRDFLLVLTLMKFLTLLVACIVLLEH